jgi:polysaccharide export outer membrane protein
MRIHLPGRILILVAMLAGVPPSLAQTTPPSQPVSAAAPASPVPVSEDYVIGPEDVLSVTFWREQEMSGEVTVRPDGMITLPLLGDVKAAGLRPEELREYVQKAASRYLADANVTVAVRQINSRKVFITGQVGQPGAYPLPGPRTVMQVIALAGGLNEYADAKNISIMRNQGGQVRTFKFNYREVSKGRRLEQNIQLQPGDTVVVP